jgi:hypothetical protein
MTSASVAQANVGGESYRCEWNSNDPARACNERLPTPEALYVSTVRVYCHSSLHFVDSLYHRFCTVRI